MRKDPLKNDWDSSQSTAQPWHAEPFDTLIYYLSINTQSWPHYLAKCSKPMPAIIDAKAATYVTEGHCGSQKVKPVEPVALHAWIA